MTKITIPRLSLVVLIGPSGSGKSTFARKHFLPTEVLSSDACRGMVGDDENDQSVTTDAFEVLHFIAGKRLALGRLTVVDATNVQLEARKPLVALARQYHCLPVAIVLNVPEKVCQERNRSRDERSFGPHVVRQQVTQMRRSIRVLGREGFRHVFVLDSPEAVEAATVERVPLWNDKRAEHGPLDIIGDVHGCCDELEDLLQRLGYVPTSLEGEASGWGTRAFAHPEGRKAVFVGDLVDRGPRILDSVRLVRNMVRAGSALCVPGNHDMKLMRKLRGKDVQITHGLADSLAEIDILPDEVREPFRKELAEFLDSLVSHYVLDDGKLVVAHAGMKAEMQGRGSGKVRDFALYGETTGETDEFGLPVRFNWAADYRAPAMVVYGHTPVPEPDWLNRTVNIDTGCVFGGKLTALRYPEKEFVSVPAARTYCEPARPFLPEEQQAPKLVGPAGPRRCSRRRGRAGQADRHDPAAGQRHHSGGPCHGGAGSDEPVRRQPEVADLPAAHDVAVRNERRAGPAGTSRRGVRLLPQPGCAAGHLRREAHGVEGRRGRLPGRTGGEGAVRRHRRRDRHRLHPHRPAVLQRTGLGDSGSSTGCGPRLTAADVWSTLQTTWVCLDCELMPWSAKAQELLKSQYAAVGAAGQASLPRAVASLAQAAGRLGGEEQDKVEQVLAECRSREEHIGQFVAAYRQYCWPVTSLTDLKLAPFHLLASEGRVHTDKNHTWHMDTLATVCRADPELLLATPYKIVDVTDPASQAEGVGMVDRANRPGRRGHGGQAAGLHPPGTRGLAQPAVKCRGREYLRIIYGPDYTADENLSRLRSRGLGHKRSLALGEFALGIEGLERFVRREPLRRVHECVFGVLALESEPVDPRL